MIDPTTLLIAASVVVIATLGLTYHLYAVIIKKRNRVLEALSNIDAQLQLRFDLLPNILKVAKRFMEHESSLFQEITTLRTQASKPYNQNNPDSVTEHLATAQELNSKMGNLVVAVENYPALKSDQTMVQAMQTYNEVEGQLSAARRFYNSSVATLNNSIQIFPSSVIAQWIRIAEMPFFQAEASTKKPIDADQVLR
jgi:LemA protein